MLGDPNERRNERSLHKRWATTSLLALLCLSGVAAQPRPEPATTAETEIRALITRYGAAANAHDLQAVMRCYAGTDSVLVYDVANKPLRGLAAVTDDWGRFMAVMRAIDLQFRDIEVTVSPSADFAYATFIERAALTPQQGAPIVIDNLRTTHIYKKVNGRWLIVHEHKSESHAG